MTVKQCFDAVCTLHKVGLKTKGTFIIGSPDETRKDVFKTLNFIKKSKLDLFQVYMLTPFPGTKVWEYAENRGLVSENMDWDKLNTWGILWDYDSIDDLREEDLMLCEEMSKRELIDLYRMFGREKNRRERNERLREYLKKSIKSPWKIFPWARKKLIYSLNR